MMFDPVDPKQRLPDLEEGILQYWREEDTFKRSIRHRRRGEADAWDKAEQNSQSSQCRAQSLFSFYDGPPFATGLPHYGHLLAGTIKDVIPRYRTMRGAAVERRFGWDCHGLPIENLIEKEHNIGSKKEIEEMGVAKFNALCRGSVQRYAKEWRTVVERMGRWVDMDWDYKTMDAEYMESIWWVFKNLADRKLIYEGRKSMHVCPRCVTPLSNFEVSLGYKDVSDWTVIAEFPIEKDSKDSEGRFVLLAWTTTGWTLPGNLFLAVGPKITYAKVRTEGDERTFVVAENLVASVFKDRQHEVVGTLKAKELVGKYYEPLFPYFAEKYKKHPSSGSGAFRVVMGDFVTTEDGTGIVHIAPGFGTDDYEVGKREKVDVLSHVTMDGKMVDAVTDFAGLDVKPFDDGAKTDRKIAATLKERGRLFAEFPYKHSYPHCWRCDSPLINYATSSWFVAVEKIKNAMLDSNAETSWVPAHIRDGRFGKWLEGARDWAISRNRFWGTPLPIWRSDHESRITNNESTDYEVIGSRNDLMQRKLIRFTKVTTLRHAESEGNLIPIYQGKLPGTDLTKKGKDQAKAAADYLSADLCPLTTIYCSPLARAKQTAEIIAKKTGATIVVDERLREVDFGEYEGKTVDFSDLSFLKARRQHKIETGKPESIYHFPGMESWESVQQRVGSLLKEVLPKHRSEHILIVSHADPVVNMEHFFTGEDAVKLSHRPYPEKAVPKSYFWDHDANAQMDLHMDAIDSITWPGMKTKNSVEITLVRHGETTLNLERKANGWTNDMLTEKGKNDALAAAKKLKKQKFDAIVCSDLPRAKETAEIIARELDMKINGEWQELRERNDGAWEGVPDKEILKANPPVDPSFVTTSFHHATPGGNAETLSQFVQRADRARRKLLAEFPGKRVLVVTHGGMIRSLRCLTENLTFRQAAGLYPKNGEFYGLQLNPLMQRIPDVLDCWFESGSMPYAQDHFPFEMRHKGVGRRAWGVGMQVPQRPTPNTLPPNFPADFIAEGVDQTRGWFYTLNVLGAALFETSPFRNCVVNGIVLAEDGKKMSKRLKNYPDPMDVVARHGADAVRFTLMSSPAVRGEDVRFSEKLVEETVRSVLLPLWNTYSFFTTYANAAKCRPTENRKHSTHPLDVWIRAEMQDLVNRMTGELDRYDLSATCAEIHETLDALTNWYVRLSRRRFAGKGVLDAYPDTSGDTENEDREDALHTLYDVLLTLSQLLAPFCPFITEGIYLNLVAEDHSSIHLTDWPETRELTKTETKLLEKNRLLRLIVGLGNSIRSSKKIKNRQPLSIMTVALPPSYAGSTCSQDDLDLLRQELNVKTIGFAKDPAELAESFMQVDARKVGPRLGGRVQEIIKAGKAGEFTVEDDGRILILDEWLAPDEAQIVYRGKEGKDVAAERGVVVSIDTTLTDDLIAEGTARDIIRGIQRLRKEGGLEFTDRIALQISGADDVLKRFGELIAQETRAELVENNGQSHTIEAGEGVVTIRFLKQ
ncbi:class I tRNA ligase family protein [Candidatus Peregrinibacteria bacterium]|nr:class I tRNA ligase family protein [Candidatus Peregrinibacteria bacterium]